MLLWLNSCLGDSCRASLSLQPVSASTCNHQVKCSGYGCAAAGSEDSSVAVDKPSFCVRALLPALHHGHGSSSFQRTAETRLHVQERKNTDYGY